MMHDIFLSPYFSTQLKSCQAKVYQSLAKFIHWTDSLLISPQAPLDKDNARQIIESLSSGVKVTGFLSQEQETAHRPGIIQLFLNIVTFFFLSMP
jgi:hypothetical protein